MTIATQQLVINDVLKKHLKIVGYLMASAGLGYVLSIIIARPEAIYFTPVINYILYALEQELKNEGFIKVLKQE